MNSQSFSPEDVQAGLHLKLINTLLEINAKTERGYNDIHLWTDGYTTIIDWCFVYYDDGYNEGKFSYISDEQVVMYEKLFPDNHYEIFNTEDEYKEALSKWLKKNKTWKQDQYGHWYDSAK